METLQEETLFLALAQIAVALAGFSGIVNVFSAPGRREVQNNQAVKIILELSFSAASVSLLPLVIQRMSGSMTIAIATSSAVLSLLLLAELGLQVKRLVNLVPRGLGPRTPFLYVTVLIIPCLVCVVGSVLNALIWHNVVLHLAMVLVLIAIVCVQFWLIAATHEGSKQPVESGEANNVGATPDASRIRGRRR